MTNTKSGGVERKANQQTTGGKAEMEWTTHIELRTYSALNQEAP